MAETSPAWACASSGLTPNVAISASGPAIAIKIDARTATSTIGFALSPPDGLHVLVRRCNCDTGYTLIAMVVPIAN